MAFRLATAQSVSDEDVFVSSTQFVVLRLREERAVVWSRLPGTSLLTWRNQKPLVAAWLASTHVVAFGECTDPLASLLKRVPSETAPLVF